MDTHYERHAQAARALIETQFDAGRVLSRLLEEGLAPQPASAPRQHTAEEAP